MSACERERGNEWIRLFNYLNAQTTQQQSRGGTSLPEGALQLSRCGIPPSPPPAPCRPSRTRHPARETDFICFDHRPCSLTTQPRRWNLAHLPRGLIRPSAPRSPPRHRRAPAAEEHGGKPGASGTGAATLRSHFLRDATEPPSDRLIPRPGGERGGRGVGEPAVAKGHGKSNRGYCQ